VDEAHTVINERNEFIHGSLDRIGPQVAAEIEKLKLAIKAEQDLLGPNAEAALARAANFALGASLLAIALGLVLATVIGRGIARPVQSITGTMQELAAGNVEVRVTDTHRRDEVGQMALAVEVFRESMAAARRYDEERREAEQEIREARDAAEAANESLDEKNTMLEGLSSKLSKYLSPQVYETIFTGAGVVVLRTERNKLTFLFS
jgi:methyl-accepting chemotaxis protein